MQVKDFDKGKFDEPPVKTPATGVNWGDPSAPQSQEDTQMKLRSGIDAIKRKLAKHGEKR